MYVKLFNRILDSSIADNRRLRHFFTDMLLCADPDGNVVMTKKALANRIRATDEEVEWGLAELMKPDPESLTTDEDGRRVIPLDGHGYGWKIVNYSMYRDYRTSVELRKATAERVRKHREKKKSSKPPPGGLAYQKMVDNGATEDELAAHVDRVNQEAIEARKAKRRKVEPEEGGL